MHFVWFCTSSQNADRSILYLVSVSHKLLAHLMRVLFCCSFFSIALYILVDALYGDVQRTLGELKGFNENRTTMRFDFPEIQE